MSRRTPADRYVGPAEILWLKDALELAKIPRSVIATKLEVDPSAVSKILSGERKLKRQEFILLRAHIGAEAVTPAKRLSRILKFPLSSTPRTVLDAGVSPERLEELIMETGDPVSEKEIAFFGNLFGLDPLTLQSLPRTPDLDEPKFGAPRRIRDWRQSGRIFDFEGFEAGPGKIPVYAGIEDAGDGFFADTLRPVEMRLIPAMDAIIGGFAIRVDTDLLSPRFENGELILLEHGCTPMPGKWAMAQDGYGRLAMGRLVSRTGTALTLERNGQRQVISIRSVQPLVSSVVGVWSQ